MDESIAAQSAKLSSLALIPEVISSQWEDACGCSGDQVSASKRIHQTVKVMAVYIFGEVGAVEAALNFRDSSHLNHSLKSLSSGVRFQG